MNMYDMRTGNPNMSAVTPTGPPNSYTTLESHATSFLAPSRVTTEKLSSSLTDSVSLEVEDMERTTGVTLSGAVILGLLRCER